MVSLVSWTPTNQKRATAYRVAFSEDKADFPDALIPAYHTRMEVVVSAEDNAEIRRVSLTNNS